MRYGSTLGAYEIVDLPGSPQCAVSIHSFIFNRFRGKGYGKYKHKERLDILKYLGYDYVLCTVDAANAREVKILESNKWTHLDTFVSSASGHTVRIYGRRIVQEAQHEV